MPRIRVGSTIENPASLNLVLNHTIDNKQVICEIIKDEQDLVFRFISINWFNDKNENLLFPVGRISFNNRYTNYTSIFPRSFPIEQNNDQVFKCCTIGFGNEIGKCQNFLPLLSSASNKIDK